VRRQGFARGYGAELGEAVKQPDFLFVEVARGIPASNLGSVFETE